MLHYENIILHTMFQRYSVVFFLLYCCYAVHGAAHKAGELQQGPGKEDLPYAEIIQWEAPVMADNGRYCYSRSMPAGCYWVEQFTQALDMPNMCLDVELMLAGFMSAAENKCPDNNSFKNKKSLAQYLLQLRHKLVRRENDACGMVEMKMGGLLMYFADKCPQSMLLKTVCATFNSTKCTLTAPRVGRRHRNSLKRINCVLCTTLVSAAREYPESSPMFLQQACDNTILFSEWCHKLLGKYRAQFYSSADSRFMETSTQDLCYGFGLCTHPHLSEMRHKAAVTVVNSNETYKETDKARTLDCYLCVNVGNIYAASIAAGKNQETAEQDMEDYCNTTILFNEYCLQIVFSLGTSIKNAISITETWRMCARAAFCKVHHYSTFRSSKIGIPGSEMLPLQLSLPVTLRDSKFTILDPVIDGPVQNLQSIMQIVVNTPVHIDNIVPTEPMAQLKFLARYGLIHNSVHCPTCPQNQNMALQRDKSAIDKYIWKCTPCKRGGNIVTKSVRTGSFFDQSHLSFYRIVKLSAIWALQPTLTYDQIQASLGPNEKGELISKSTLVDWYNFFRDVCQQWCADNAPIRALGGPNTVVEVDESVLYKAKYNRGRRRHHVWVIGMVQRGTANVVLQEVAQRDAQTLLPIIQQWVLPGTDIITDQWAAYNGIPALPQGYRHFTVNHRRQFVAQAPPQPAGAPPPPPIHTQTIEATWASLKWSLKHLKGTSEELFPTYMYQYMFRKSHNGEKIWNNFWCAVSVQYA